MLLDIGYNPYAVGYNIDACLCIVIATKVFKIMLMQWQKPHSPTTTTPPQPYKLIHTTVHPQVHTNGHTLHNQLLV